MRCRPTDVFIEACSSYDASAIEAALDRWDFIFAESVRPGNLVVLKPNWIAPSHKYDPDVWESVITHPNVITAVLHRVLMHLKGSGRVVITDGPQTQSSWQAIMDRMMPDLWTAMGRSAGTKVEILDLRDDEWRTERDVIVSRTKLAGDPLGSTECNLREASEFANHKPGPKGYFGADYDRSDTNAAHSNGNHRYKVSRTVMSADVFINLPKLKTHKKAGITASLKNLVGINTYKNWLPHHTEGSPEEGGDQFPQRNVKTSIEGKLLESSRRLLSSRTYLGPWLAPVKSLLKPVFGDTRHVVRNGSWYGNQTIWRMILDLNKVLLYANPDGMLREDHRDKQKRYISVVDAIVAGEGNGPEAPDPKPLGLLVAGTNPLAVDALCCLKMGFDWRKIPAIQKAFEVRHYPLGRFDYSDIEAHSETTSNNGRIEDLRVREGELFRPHFGWKHHIEFNRFSSVAGD